VKVLHLVPQVGKGGVGMLRDSRQVPGIAEKCVSRVWPKKKNRPTVYRLARSLSGKVNPPEKETNGRHSRGLVALEVIGLGFKGGRKRVPPKGGKETFSDGDRDLFIVNKSSDTGNKEGRGFARARTKKKKNHPQKNQAKPTTA